MTATWDPEKDLWIRDNCEPSDVFSETFPISGTMRNGRLFPLPGSALPIDGSASSSSRGLLPTPVASQTGNTPEDHLRKKPGRTRVTDLGIIVDYGLLKTGGKLLPTPKAADGDFGLPRTSGRPPEKSTHLATRMHYTDFGDYAQAVERWESATRPAPSPTKPNEKGRELLSPDFVEWMMGLPEGWVTDPSLGLSRSKQLKALGNGVVPQQARAALGWLRTRKELF